ncbi:hypothetical protein Tco_0766153 [Tanacetum coccineum]
MVKSWLVQDQTVLGKDYSNLLIADSLLKTIWFINAPCYGNEALASPKANGFGKDKSNPLIVGSLLKTTRWIAKDVDEDGKCLKIRSRCVKVFGYILQELKKINLKKHEVKQVQQSCLREDCWELFIPNLVPLERLYTSTGNPVKEILLKLNLPDHSIKVKKFQRSFRHSDIERLSRSEELLKLKNFKKNAAIKLFKSTNQERYEHVGPDVTSSQDGKVYKMAKRMLG